MSAEVFVNAVRAWIDGFVVEYDLCPFARRELAKGSVRITVSDATSIEKLLESLQSEMALLTRDKRIATTLIVHPHVLQDFVQYNDFLSLVDLLLEHTGLVGVYQIASFHPDYQFEGTRPDDAENYTNRSPYPMLHVLREDSVERAVSSYPDADQIPNRNIRRMNEMGVEALARQLREFT